MSAPRSSLGLGSLLVALVIILALGVGSVSAAIPNGNGTYYACLTKSSGVVRLINYPKVKCAKGERFIKWNQQGPQGAQGAQGPAGPADWNAIPNIPAGFADGVDDLGPSYASSIIFSGQIAPANVVILNFQNRPPNVDYHFSVIPTDPGAYLDFDVEWVTRNPDGTLSSQIWLTHKSGGATGYKIRATAFADGIAPAGLKQQVKDVEVRVVDRKRR